MNNNKYIIVHKIKMIAFIFINRLYKYNALNISLLKQLKDCLKYIVNDKNIRIIVFIGLGKNVFCVGADLKERLLMNQKNINVFINLINYVFNYIESISLPSIAILNGMSLGGGLELALACDIRIALNNSILGLPECSLGIIPGAGGTQRLSKIIGLSRAKEMIYCAKLINGIEAYHIGLVNHVRHNMYEAISLVFKISNLIYNNGQLSVKYAKRVMNCGLSLNMNKGLILERRNYNNILLSKDRIEGLQAFYLKRKPTYKGY